MIVIRMTALRLAIVAAATVAALVAVFWPRHVAAQTAFVLVRGADTVNRNPTGPAADWLVLKLSASRIKP